MATKRIARAPFRRSKTYVAVRPVRRSKTGRWMPGEVVETRTQRLKMLYLQRYVGEEGHPWTDAMLERWNEKNADGDAAVSRADPREDESAFDQPEAEDDPGEVDEADVEIDGDEAEDDDEDEEEEP